MSAIAAAAIGCLRDGGKNPDKQLQNGIYRIKDGKDSLLHLSDLAHNHVLMMHDPSWFIDFDHHPEQAIATRRKVFAEIGATRERAYGFHLPWPGLGVLVPKGKDSYLWSAESWRWDV